MNTSCPDCGVLKDKKSRRCKACHLFYCASISLRKAGRKVKARERQSVAEKPQACVQGKAHYWRHDAEERTWECRWCLQVTIFATPSMPFGYNGADVPMDDPLIRDVTRILEEAGRAH